MRQTPRLDPAATVILKCGGERAIAEALGLSVNTIRRWAMPRDRDSRNGTGGLIPAQQHQKLLDTFDALQPTDFFASATSFVDRSGGTQIVTRKGCGDKIAPPLVKKQPIEEPSQPASSGGGQ